MSDTDSDEGPDQVSFESSKDAAKTEQRLVNLQKQNDKQIAKLKRKLRQDTFLVQKQEKASKQSSEGSLFSEILLEELRQEIPEKNEPMGQESEVKPIPLPRSKSNIKKTYKKLNMEVRTLGGLHLDRASMAAGFKEKRLAKVHRESVSTNLAHTEKLTAAGKNFF